MNQKELEEEQKLIAVNQIRKSELKAKQKMYASSTTFGRQMRSHYVSPSHLNLYCSIFRSITAIKKPALGGHSHWWRGEDLNFRPSGYEPDELPDCSTPRSSRSIHLYVT